MNPSRLWPFALVVVLSGCAGAPTVPENLHHGPGEHPALDDMVHAARLRWEQGSHTEALDAVTEVLDQAPEHVDAGRLHQEILRARGRMGRLLQESQERLDSRPTASNWYLHGRIQPMSAAKAKAFERALKVDPQHFWAWYGKAFVLREADPARAAAIYQRLYASTKGHRQVAVALGGLLRQQKKYQEATKVYAGLTGTDPGTASIGVAESLYAGGRRRQAFGPLLDALRIRPFDSGVRSLIRRMLGRGMPADPTRELLDPLLTHPKRLAQFRDQGGLGLLASMLEQSGQSAAALEVLQEERNRSPAERELYRQLCLRTGHLQAYLRDVVATMPAQFLRDESNQIAGRWQNLLALVNSMPDLRNEPSKVDGLARSMMSVGLLRDAEQLLTWALLQHAADPEEGTDEPGGRRTGWRTLRTEARQQLAFQGGIRRLVSRGYRRFTQTNKAVTLDAFFDKVRELSRNIFGRDVVGKVEILDVAFVGRLWDSFSGGLAEQLAKYNHHLVLGQRNDQPVEGMMLRRLRVTVVDPIKQVPVPPRCLEVVGENRVLSPLNMFDLAGIALLNHYVVDMDQVRVWAETLRRRRRIINEDKGALLKDPVPEQVGAEEPADVAWRLAALSSVKDRDLDMAVFDLIRWHELGHMVDFRYHLPVSQNLMRGFALLVRNGFSPDRVAGDMEGRAELVALAMSPHTRLVLGHIASFLEGDPAGSSHADGFRRVARSLMRALPGGMKAKGNFVSHWHTLDPELVREVAQKLLRRMW